MSCLFLWSYCVMGLVVVFKNYVLWSGSDWSQEDHLPCQLSMGRHHVHRGTHNQWWPTSNTIHSMTTISFSTHRTFPNESKFSVGYMYLTLPRLVISRSHYVNPSMTYYCILTWLHINLGEFSKYICYKLVNRSQVNNLNVSLSHTTWHCWLFSQDWDMRA